MFCHEQGSIAPTPCPAGFYCAGSQSTGFQNACPIGTYSSTTGLTNGTQCEICPAGYYCPWGNEAEPTVSPTPCEPGSYNPLTGTGHELNCRQCPASFACPLIAQTDYTEPCHEG